MTCTASIYILCESDGTERYVGQTRGDPAVRLSVHRAHAARRTSPPVLAWIARLPGQMPVLKVIETCPSDIALERERFWIRHYEMEGANLLNIRRGKLDWRARLTADEQSEVDHLQASIIRIEDQRAALVARLGPIRNRAIQRARYDATTPQKETTN